MLAGKTALVTGSVGGIGNATARALAQRGCAVMIHGLTDIKDGEAIAKQIAEEFKVKTAFSNADLSKLSEIELLIKETSSKLGSIDILVNNAGVGGSKQRLHEIEPADFDRVINVNLRGCFLMSKFAIPHFLAQRDGRIVHVASTYGLIGAPKATAYCASKGGIINLTKQMAVDYGPDNIRVCAVCP